MYKVNPRDLTWDDVDPARIAFDADAVAGVVRAAGPARAVPERPAHATVRDFEAYRAWRHVSDTWADAMSQALTEHYGPWVAGWRWARGEGDFDGGPIGNWCCPSDTMTTAEATLERVVASVKEWREWLEFLARWFRSYPLDLAEVEDQRPLWEGTARSLILHVLDRTGHESGWYGHCRVVLSWFLSSQGVKPEAAAELVGAAVGGRFHSWTAPDTPLVDDVAAKLSGPLKPGDALWTPAPAPDQLADWLAVRGTVDWDDAVQRSTRVLESGREKTGPFRDGVIEDIRTFDAAIDPARAEGLLAAVELVRADAARGAVLDFELLRRWQQPVLGTADLPEFRTLPAFAKGGRERYGIAADTRERFDRCLAEAGPCEPGGPGGPGGPGDSGSSGDSGAGCLPLSARAARAYLDVCFFHPFDDGNSRAALLALVFVLAREGAVLDHVQRVRRISIVAGDSADASRLTWFVDMARHREW